MTWPFDDIPSLQSGVSEADCVETLARRLDWENTPVGPIEKWPHSLKSTVRILLDCRLPMYLAWGRDHTQFYNDAYRPILGNKHPEALGNDARRTWPEIWDTIGPMWENVWRGESIGSEDFKLTINRYGYSEDCYFSFSYSPVPDDAGNIAGVLVTFAETTQIVLAERRQAFQLKLADSLRYLTDPVEIMVTAAALLGEHTGVARVGYGEIDASGETVSVARDWTNGAVASLAGEARELSSFGPDIIAELRAGRTLQLDDIAADSRSAPYAQGYAGIGARSLLIVPLIKSHGLAAFLYLHHPVPHTWSPADVALAEDVAERTWNALERARAELALQTNLTVLTQLNQVSQSVYAELRLEPLLQSATEAAVKVSGAQFGAFFHNTVDASGEAYTLYTVAGVPREAFSGFPMPRNTEIFGPTFLGTGVKRSADITRDPAYGRSAPYHGMPKGHLPVRSYLAVPVMTAAGHVFGGIFLGHPEPDRFSSEHEQIIQGIATQASIGLTNSQLYQSKEILLAAEREARSMAERESRLKEQFLNTLSHELRTPLNAIVGWAELLKMRHKGNAELEKALTVINRNAQAQATIINDLLDMSRIASGNVRLDLQAVDLAQAVDEAIDSIRPRAEAKGVALGGADDADPTLVSADPSRLQQILWNLLTNAVKFTPEGGAVEVSIAAGGDHATVTVADTGRGMDKQVLPFIFDRFRQGDGSTAREHGGLGLGLSIVKSLVELHGGTIDAQSDGIGKGATFTMTLPVATRAGGSDPHRIASLDSSSFPVQADPLYPLKGIKVLVVDDEHDALEMMRVILENAGALVTTALSAQEAMDSIAIARPHFLLSDVGMPVQDGYTFIRMVREIEKKNGFGPIPAAALTAFARPEDAALALHAGFDAHLVKPITASRILSTIAALTIRHAPT
jgi:signal transduction histidine kinase/ActR/RegA family two-component response regulator